ncbi:HlyD family secretion protein [Roseibium aggregatum]|uniref:HlyD family secretion protein n=1 Tax=Roseibium aggregatum TaxID=187304 RepID=UPI001AD8A940|nr:HlyD family secretion protein [Roseibium aggregatum]
MALREGRNESGAIGGGPQTASPQKDDGKTADSAESKQATPSDTKDASEAKGGQVAVPSKAQVSISTASEQTPPPKKKGKAKRVFTLILLAGLGFGGYEAYHWWTEGRFIASTDDAYVTADITVILSKVSGYVASVAVGDNQRVKAGDVLLKIDDGDYKLAVQSAKDSIDSARATVNRIATQITAAKASVQQAEASVAAATAKKDEASANFDRQKKLADNKFASQATLDTADAALKGAQADLENAQAAVTLAKANIDVLNGQQKEAEQAVVAAKTALEKAERDLAFTVIRAPVDGIVGNRAAQVGSLLQPGSRIAAIVPLADTHIDANFKETQLEGIQPGAEVEISVDAYPDQPIRGTVESIAPATGSVFSLLPAENATGNFTKVVQRVPVKIKVPEEEITSGHLRAGMSVVVAVDTRTGGQKADVTVSALH